MLRYNEKGFYYVFELYQILCLVSIIYIYISAFNFKERNRVLNWIFIFSKHKILLLYVSCHDDNVFKIIFILIFWVK
jgi:hypothetical protein